MINSLTHSQGGLLADTCIAWAEKVQRSRLIKLGDIACLAYPQEYLKKWESKWGYFTEESGLAFLKITPVKLMVNSRLGSNSIFTVNS